MHKKTDKGVSGGGKDAVVRAQDRTGFVRLQQHAARAVHGIRQLELTRGSLPVSTTFCHSVSIFPVTFISDTGRTTFPFSIRKPSMP